jgi:hypothetical protein
MELQKKIVYNVGDICYIVTPCSSYDQFDDDTEYYLRYAENIKVIQVRVIAAEGIPIVRNGRTRMEYQIESTSVFTADIYSVKRSGSLKFKGGIKQSVWYADALFPNLETAYAERQKQLEKYLKEAEVEFNEQLSGIKNLIKSN